MLAKRGPEGNRSQAWQGLLLSSRHRHWKCRAAWGVTCPRMYQQIAARHVFTCINNSWLFCILASRRSSPTSTSETRLNCKGHGSYTCICKAAYRVLEHDIGCIFLPASARFLFSRCLAVVKRRSPEDHQVISRNARSMTCSGMQ